MTIQVKGSYSRITRASLLVILSGNIILALGCQSPTTYLTPYTPATETLTMIQTQTQTQTQLRTETVVTSTPVTVPLPTVTVPPTTVVVLTVTSPPSAATERNPPTRITTPSPADRSYSREHIWVKAVSADTVQIGITSVIVNILIPSRLEMPTAGAKLTKGGFFGTIEGYRMSTDLISPVSGTVTQINTALLAAPGQLATVSADPYGTGWLLVVQLSNPVELSTLLSSAQYDLLAGTG